METEGRKYSKDDIENIIREGLKEENQEWFSKEDVLELGKNLGLQSSTLEEVMKRRAEAKQNKREEQSRLKQLMHAAVPHGGKFLIISIFLFLLNAVVSSYWWCVFPILGIGMGTAFKLLEEFEKIYKPHQQRDQELNFIG